MLIIYFLKTVAILLSYIMGVTTAAVLVLYLRQMCKAVITKKSLESTPRILTIAKVIVFFTDLAVLALSIFIIANTFDWQKSLLNAVVSTVTIQPAFALLLIPMVAYPAMSLKKLSIDMDK